MNHEPFLVEARIDWERVRDRSAYPFSIPAIAAITTLRFHPRVTFLIGENGTGKSTLLEAIAVAIGFNAEGGSKNFNFTTRSSHSSLHEFIVLDRGRNIRKPKDGFFFRAESFFNVATEVDRLNTLSLRGPMSSFGGDQSLHDQSHGESFFTFVEQRLGANGIYIFDEPEAALSPMRQLALHEHLARLTKQHAQLIIATHSPIILGYPDAHILQLGPNGAQSIAYEETEHFRVTRDYLRARTEGLAGLSIRDGDV